jgi:Rieske 2Fe-2S family protein
MTGFMKTTALSTEGARTLERAEYVSPEVFAREQERIFAREWLCVGRESMLAAAGQYVLLEVGPYSLIVVRDRGGVVRALHNTCRHRGTRLCDAPCGELSETIQCPYHAWTYGLDGRLLGVPDAKEIEGFDKADWPLRQAHVATWEGFVFVNLAESPVPFAEAYAPLIARFGRWNLGALRAARRIEYDVRANWKLLFENYSECYHCSPVHPSLVKLSSPTSGENDLMEGPFLGGFMTVTAEGGSLTASGRACGVPVADLPADDLQRVYYYSIFPNMLLSLHPDYVMVHTFRPVAPDRTLVTCEFLFHAATLERADLDPDDGVRFWDTVNREDWDLCERTQKGVTSPAYVPGPYSRRESLCAAFDRHYREVMRSPGAPLNTRNR